MSANVVFYQRTFEACAPRIRSIRDIARSYLKRGKLSRIVRCVSIIRESVEFAHEIRQKLDEVTANGIGGFLILEKGGKR